jgi:hypothetical protein
MLREYIEEGYWRCVVEYPGIGWRVDQRRVVWSGGRDKVVRGIYQQKDTDTCIRVQHQSCRLSVCCVLCKRKAVDFNRRRLAGRSREDYLRYILMAVST